MANGGATPKKPAKQSVGSETWHFILQQAALLVACIGVYIWLHFYYPAESTYPTGRELVHLDSFGRATVVSAEDMDWYVGSTKSVPLLAQMDGRNKSIELRAGSIRQQMQDLASQFSEDAALPVRARVDCGDFRGAARRLASFRAQLAPGNETVADERLLSQLEQTLRELDELKHDQIQSRELLQPPKKFLLYWATPWGIVAEVAAWSLFGLFASLLYHSARFARKGRFRPAEMYVGWTKPFYTPIVAAVLVLAIAEGLLNLGTIVTRMWMIPLLGALAGFNARKAAKLVDALSEWSLGRMADSLKGGKGKVVPSSVLDIQQALMPPETFDDLAENLKASAAAMLTDKLNQLPKTT